MRGFRVPPLPTAHSGRARASARQFICPKQCPQPSSCASSPPKITQHGPNPGGRASKDASSWSPVTTWRWVIGPYSQNPPRMTQCYGSVTQSQVIIVVTWFREATTDLLNDAVCLLHVSCLFANVCPFFVIFLCIFYFRAKNYSH